MKTVLLYMLAASSKIHHKDWKRIKKPVRAIGAENIMMTLAEYYRQEGLQEGWQKGKQEGIQEGKQEGKEEGIQEGRKEGQIVAIERILSSRLEHCRKT